MPPIAQPLYVALEPLPVTDGDGTRRILAAGEEIADPDSWGSALDMNIQLGKIAMVMDYTDEGLIAEAKRRGFKVTRAKSDA